MLPTFLMEGPLVWPGQHAGFLGPRHDPWQIRQDPSLPDFRVSELALPDGFSVERLEQRRNWLDSIEAGDDAWQAKAEAVAKSDVDIIAGGRRRSDRPAARPGVFALALGQGGACLRPEPRGSARPRSLRPAHVRPVAPAGAPLDPGGGADRSGQPGAGPALGHALGQLQEPEEIGFCRRPTRASRRCSTTWRRPACSTRRWWSSPASSAARPGSAPPPATSTAPTAATTGRRSFRRSSPARGFAAARRSASPTATAPTPPAAPTRPGDFAATIYRGAGHRPRDRAPRQLGRPIRLCNGTPIEPLFSADPA